MPFITADNASELGKKGNLTRWSQPVPIATPKVIADDAELYRKERLARVRKQLDRLDAWVMTEKDPSKLDRLYAAQARAAVQEQQLSGRALPGTLRPVQGKPKRTEPAAEPTVSEAETPQEPNG